MQQGPTGPHSGELAAGKSPQAQGKVGATRGGEGKSRVGSGQRSDGAKVPKWRAVLRDALVGDFATTPQASAVTWRRL